MEYLAIWMFVVMTALLLLGFPVAFTLLGTSLFFGLLGFGWSFFDLLPLRVWGVMTNFTLVAVPLFVFMGVMLERAGIAGELLEAMALLFGRIRGGLAVTVVVVGALLGASTGIVGATVVTMGLLALPTMLKHRYQHELATGTVAAAGTLGQIIPPSIILVLLGDVIGVSVGDLFVGALLPGLLLVGLYMAYILVQAWRHPERAPAVDRREADIPEGTSLPRLVARALVPPMVLIVAVLGSIFAGIASPTEAAGLGASGATLLCMARGRFDRRILREVMAATTQLTSMVFIILVGAAAFGLVFRGLGGPALIREFIFALPLGRWGILALVMGLIFVVGFFLDFIEITFIYVPILTPILHALHFDPVWFAVLFAMNLQTSFLTPPFGFSLFYLKGVAPPGVSTLSIYRGIVPFVALQLAALAIVVLVPGLATWLPGVVAAR
ncbi:TRAP transporter large permease subunit [Dissulfurirhabdus thermomarina]|uniref:TRAP transporter large permease subunit n=1 Tax=Dissulfurirhabdus thermomarina TaxID=1765737 RepID=A0A6N9TQA9_DISTH|nr:TRAP transporter large permease subunit [Dissulfurirhabdus thermomarina]NDY41924.1 TRAP transporter large permease subunit [Dissulfurirhabdus thermomarina]NMX23110.1 TRAP transporter large permease subunit [Dissulfurirhabdus thermomarina]